jgi:hypothetical protein
LSLVILHYRRVTCTGESRKDRAWADGFYTEGQGCTRGTWKEVRATALQPLATLSGTATAALAAAGALSEIEGAAAEGPGAMLVARATFACGHWRC